jgi:hypothetical protein
MPELRPSPEPFVSADAAAKFLGIKRRLLLSLARKGIPGAYSIGTGGFRKHWIFLLSELAAAIREHLRYDPSQGSPR